MNKEDVLERVRQSSDKQLRQWLTGLCRTASAPPLLQFLEEGYRRFCTTDLPATLFFRSPNRYFFDSTWPFLGLKDLCTCELVNHQWHRGVRLGQWTTIDTLDHERSAKHLNRLLVRKPRRALRHVEILRMSSVLGTKLLTRHKLTQLRHLLIVDQSTDDDPKRQRVALQIDPIVANRHLRSLQIEFHRHRPCWASPKLGQLQELEELVLHAGLAIRDSGVASSRWTYTLQKMPRLRRLDLDCSGVDLQDLTALKLLQELHLTVHGLVQIRDLSLLQQLPALHTLGLRWQQEEALMDDVLFLQSLPSLTELHVCVSDDLITCEALALVPLKSLTTLVLDTITPTCGEMDKLSKAYVNLRHLRLIEGHGVSLPDLLTRFPTLESLSLMRTYVDLSELKFDPPPPRSLTDLYLDYGSSSAGSIRAFRKRKPPFAVHVLTTQNPLYTSLRPY